MTRTDELDRSERRLRDLLLQRGEPERLLPEGSSLEESIVSELAYAQMQLERHLAETSPHDRESERFRLELAMPAFTSLRLWYNVSFPEEGDSGTGGTRGGTRQAPAPAEE